MRYTCYSLAQLFYICLVLLCTLFNLPLPDATAAKSKPNVLFLFTDDQRADTIHALGNSVIQTPHLDQLVKTGFVMHNAYCMGSNVGAVCFPSRNMLLSGKAYFRFAKRKPAPRDKPNFPTSMKAAGYATYHHGKKGNTAREIHKAFDVSKYVNDFEDRTSGEPGKVIVDDAISFLAEKQNAKPFFIYLAFSGPHDPRVAAEAYMQRYERETIPLPKNFLPVHPFDNGDMLVRDERLADWPRSRDEIRQHLHDYYATITAMDHHIGRLIAYLKTTGQFKNTLIVFSSDHGLAIGSHGLMGKQSLYEHSMKSPLIFSGPGISQGESQALVYLLDIFPTVCELTGVAVPDMLDGHSFAPVLLGKASTARDSIFTAYLDVQRAVRDDRWKLIRYPQVDQTQLFDLQRDPHEIRNLASQPGQQERISDLLKQMQLWQKHLGDRVSLTVPNPKKPEFRLPSQADLEKLNKPKRKSR